MCLPGFCVSESKTNFTLLNEQIGSKIMNDPKTIQRQYYAKTAHLYDKMHLGDEGHIVALKYVSNFVTMLDVSTILDVGCGTGRGVKWFLEKYPYVTNICGVEPVPALIEQATKQHSIPADNLLCGIGEALPFGDNTFDIVCEFGILHHVQNPDDVVREMIRVARKAVFISDSNRFGQGRGLVRLTKLLLYKMNLWSLVNLIKTGGKGYRITEGDGLSYSYSVYDSYNLLANWASRIILIQTTKERKAANSWYHPLLTSKGVLLCAIREEE